MTTDTREERLARRIADLYATDPQFAAAKPDPAIAEAIEQPGLPLAEIVRTVMEGYADRPALGERAVEFISDPQGRTTSRLLPHFDTITYRELWDRVNALTSAAADVHPGDRVAILGFASVDYTVIDMATIPLGAVSVPLQTSAPITSLRPIVTETEPAVHRLEHRLRRRRRRTRADRPHAQLPDRLRLPPGDHRPSRGLRRRPRTARGSRQPGGGGNVAGRARARKDVAREARCRS